MAFWRIGVLSLMLVSAVLAKDDILAFGKEDLLGSFKGKPEVNKPDPLAPPPEVDADQETGQDKMSWLAAQELVGAIKEFGNITNGPIAIYRDDLPEEYVAYWVVEFASSQYLAISSGPDTGDYMVSSQGALPSPITELDLTAKKYGKECKTYRMMTPGGEMMCRGKTGAIVATTLENFLANATTSDDDENFEHAHEHISTQADQLTALWEARAAEVAKNNIWGDDKSTTSTDSNTESFTQVYVKPGTVVRLPVDDDTVSVKVTYESQNEWETEDDVAGIQNAICQMISTCDVDDDCSISLEQQKSVLHLNYVELEISKDIPSALNGSQSIDFEIRVKEKSGEVSVKYYSLDTTSRKRQKRYKEYTSYTGWTYKSIPHEGYFPYYWQHKIHNGCYVGCGPVAWAMVFGYYDRRSHYQYSTYGSGSRDLYRCGYAGMYGSNTCIAPKYSYSSGTSGALLQKYIERIAKILGTWCIFKNGATPVYKMDRIKGYFQSRQKSGNPRVYETNNVWRLIARSSYATTTRSWIRSGWPVVVGTTEGGIFKWHYPVATKYRYRSRKYRTCIRLPWGKKWCGGWKTSYTYHMYTHQGWAGTKTKWRTFSLHYAAIAPY